MNKKSESTTGIHDGGTRGFLTSLLASLAHGALQLVLSFAVGTGAAAIVCWYYGIPLAFSILGGILVLAIALALTSDSWFT